MMKQNISTFLSLLALMLLVTPQSIFAQQTTTQSDDKVVIIQKVTTENGETVTVKKTVRKGDDMQHYLQEFDLDNGDNVEINVFSDSKNQETTLIDKNSADDETIFFFRSAAEDGAQEESQQMRIILRDHDDDNHHQRRSNRVKKALLGIYPQDVEQGVLITSLVKDGGAQKAGLLKGDIITAINGQTVENNATLGKILAQHKPGESISVNYLRDGQAVQTTSTLTAKKSGRSFHYNYNYRHDNAYEKWKRDPCKVFIGVYTSERREGVKVTSIVPNTPAEMAAIQKGDMILALDDVPVNSHRTLVHERDKHEPGDYFTLSIIRNGVAMEIDAQFKSCEKETEEELPINEVEEMDEVDVLEDQILVEEIAPIDPDLNTLQLDDFAIFPNPATGPVNLRFVGDAAPTTIRVTDATGKVVYEEVLNNFDGQYNKQINLPRVNPGTLILTVQQDQKIFSQSLVLMPRA